MANVGGNSVGREMAWKFVQDNWDEFHKRYAGLFLLQHVIRVRYNTALLNIVIYFYFVL